MVALQPGAAAVFVISLNILAYLAISRWRKQRHSRRRIQQLEQARAYLSRHAHYLQIFLNDAAAPNDLKAVLIGFSDAMADEATAAALADYICNHWDGPTQPSEEGLALLDAVDALRSVRRDLAEAFVQAVGSASAGALLRWPDAARSVELLAARLVADPDREIAVAAEGARMRSGFRFGMRPAEAMA
jgi:hypothetical protein